jgi:hypothetical protein
VAVLVRGSRGVQAVGGVEDPRLRDDELDIRYRLDVVALSVLDVVTMPAGGCSTG